jgi:hypothetical protein
LTEAREAQQRIVQYHAKLGRVAARMLARRDPEQNGSTS